MKVPVVKEGLKISINKCGVTYQDDECQDRVIALPRRACPKKVDIDDHTTIVFRTQKSTKKSML